MILINKIGNEIKSNFISGKFDKKQVEKIISEDKTLLPTGYPKLWFDVYNNKVYIVNLTGCILKEYTINKKG